MSKRDISLPITLLAVASSIFISLEALSASHFQLDLGRLWLERVGEDDGAYMRTTYVLTPVLAPKSSFLIKDGTATPTPLPSTSLPLPVGSPPSQAKFSGIWQENKEGDSKASILGGIGDLIMEKAILNIPVVVASSENLAHYGARLIKDGEIMNVESPVPLVIAGVAVGESYIRGFIMSRKHGGGEYLEFHDTPHFHMPLNKESGGVLILGKREGNNYYVTAYKIPYGYGVYTPPYVLHADAHLVGRYLVMYTYTENFSTVNLKTKTGELVEIQLSAENQEKPTQPPSTSPSNTTKQ